MLRVGRCSGDEVIDVVKEATSVSESLNVATLILYCALAWV